MRRGSILFCGLLMLLSACTAADPPTTSEATSTVPAPVTVVGPEFGIEAESFVSALAAFSERSGIQVDYQGRRYATSDVDLAVEAGLAPDIAIIAQPGRIADFATSGFAVPLRSDLVETVDVNFDNSLLDLATVDGTRYGIPTKVDLKNLVWYSPQHFAEQSFQVPETLEDLLALTETIRMNGVAPWCIGIGAGDATGWVFTDWVEQAMLSLHGPDVYAQWSSHQIVFDSPEVRQAIDLVSEFWFTNGNVANGRAAISSTQFTDAGLGLVAQECELHRQLGNYSAYYIDAGSTVAEDGDVHVFPFPVLDCQAENVTLGSGNFAVAFNDRSDVTETMHYLASAQFANDRIAFGQGGYLSPHLAQDLNLYANQIDRDLASIVLDANQFLFDASDLMPGPVGSGRFWTGGVELVEGTITVDELLSSIDAAWPDSSVQPSERESEPRQPCSPTSES